MALELLLLYPASSIVAVVSGKQFLASLYTRVL